MSNDVKLEPCPAPWCAKDEPEVEVTGYRGMEFVVCSNCGCTGPEGSSPAEAIAAWNARHQPQREAVFGETDAERVARAMDPPLWADDEETAHMAASPLQVCHARERSLDRARLFLAEYAALTTPAPARPILLEMAEASDEDKKWERRWRALGQMYAREKPCFVDSDGDWCLRDFLDYAGVICGFGGDILGSATPAPAVSRDEIVAVLDGIKARGLPDRYKSDVELNDRLAAILSRLRGEK